MLKSIFAALIALTAVNASADVLSDNVAKTMAAALERNLTIEEVQSVNEMVAELHAMNNAPVELASAAPYDDRTIAYNLGCLTIKGGAVLATTQKLVCTNLMEVFTISKAVSLSDSGTLNLSANAGVTYARMVVNPNAYGRLQNLQLLAEPVDALGIDGAYGYGLQVVVFSSPNVSLSLWGLTVGAGGGIIFEQNGAVDRELWDGTTLNIKKFTF